MSQIFEKLVNETLYSNIHWQGSGRNPYVEEEDFIKLQFWGSYNENREIINYCDYIYNIEEEDLKNGIYKFVDYFPCHTVSNNIINWFHKKNLNKELEYKWLIQKDDTIKIQISKDGNIPILDDIPNLFQGLTSFLEKSGSNYNISKTNHSLYLKGESEELQLIYDNIIGKKSTNISYSSYLHLLSFRMKTWIRILSS